MVHVPKQKRSKWDPKSNKLIFVGYNHGTKGYRCIDPVTKKLTISRDVKFLESQHKSSVVMNLEEDITSTRDISTKEEDTQSEEDSYIDSEKESFISVSEGISNDEFNKTLTPPQELRRSTRVPKPKNFEGFITYLAMGNEDDDPLTFQEAMESKDCENWKAAIDEELMSLEDNDTWELVDLPHDKKAIKCKWLSATETEKYFNTEQDSWQKDARRNMARTTTKHTHL